MIDQNSGFADAQQLEDINFNQWAVEASMQVTEKIKASERSLAARGLAQSGIRFKTEIDLIFDSIEGVIDKVIAYRRELGAKVPALLEAANIKALKDKLDRYVDGGVNGVHQRSTLQPRGAAGSADSQVAQQRAS